MFEIIYIDNTFISFIGNLKINLSFKDMEAHQYMIIFKTFA